MTPLVPLATSCICGARRVSMTGAVVRTVDVPSATDPSNHVLAGDIVSPDSNNEVRRLLGDFLREHVPGRAAAPGGSPDE